jgi:DNA invertase Pin-like site-specific DNA recombinase
MLIPAAQYLRMSTEHQQYSLLNQSAAIASYAEANGFRITRTYQDPGRSGLAIKNRPGLTNLLRDVVMRKYGFQAVLVYDVSRWGRFQDSDEAAHYEFLCKRAGIPVHYCSEQFRNDGTAISFLLKSIKRTMAAEYSRELGVKVHTGQARLAAMGYKMGGPAIYGLRRMLVDMDGNWIRELQPGERKILSTHRVILVPGPAKEQAIVREIFSMALAGKRSLNISRELNKRQIPFLNGKTWELYHVLGILQNPAYAGINVWGRTSQSLMRGTIRLPPAQWIRCENAFRATIDSRTFSKVQEIFARDTLYSDEELLDGLRRLLARRGRLSEKIIAVARDVPSPHTYQLHFGSLNRAYQLVGYAPVLCSLTTKERRANSIALRNKYMLHLARTCPSVVRLEIRNRKLRPHLIVDKSIVVSTLVLPTTTTISGHLRWLSYPVPKEINNVTLACALDATNTRIRSSYVWAPGLKRVTFRHLREMCKWGFRLTGPTLFPQLVRKAARLAIRNGTLTVRQGVSK